MRSRRTVAFPPKGRANTTMKKLDASSGFPERVRSRTSHRHRRPIVWKLQNIFPDSANIFYPFANVVTYDAKVQVATSVWKFIFATRRNCAVIPTLPFPVYGQIPRLRSRRTRASIKRLNGGVNPPVRVGRCLVDEKRGCMKARRLIYERKSRVNARFRAPPGVK